MLCNFIFTFIIGKLVIRRPTGKDMYFKCECKDKSVPLGFHYKSDPKSKDPGAIFISVVKPKTWGANAGVRSGNKYKILKYKI